MKDWLIIDGYNLIHQIFPEDRHGDLASLARNRKKLIIQLEPLVNLLARKITVVFDGQTKEARNGEKDSEVINVVYSPSSSADTLIENLVWKAEHPENILVVTSDRLERNAADASGADTIASSLFIAMLREEQERLHAKIRLMNKKHENITLGAFFPDISREAPRGKPRDIFAQPSEARSEASERAKNDIPPYDKPQGFLAKDGKKQD